MAKPSPRRHSGLTRAAIQAQALANATQHTSTANYRDIFEGFQAMGIPPDQILPRENVFTFNAWRHLGRHVRKGEHGVTVVTMIQAKPAAGGAASPEMATTAAPDLASPETASYKMARRVAVFHISQTDPDDSPAASPLPAMQASVVPS
jgi:antirestriction protein ArdC